MTPPDELSDLLAPSPVRPNGDTAFDATLAGLRKLRRGTRIRRAVVPAVTFVLGGGLVALFMPERVRETVRVEAVEVVREKIVTVYEPPPMPAPPPTPREIERLAASAPPDRRPALYRRAADRWLEEGQQVTEALRCYRVFLDAAGPAGWGYEPDDTSLLAALKRDRRLSQEEKR